MRPISPNKYQE